MRTMKALARLCRYAGSPEPLPVACDKYHNFMSLLNSFDSCSSVVSGDHFDMKMFVLRKNLSLNRLVPFLQKLLSLIYLC